MYRSPRLRYPYSTPPRARSEVAGLSYQNPFHLANTNIYTYIYSVCIFKLKDNAECSKQILLGYILEVMRVMRVIRLEGGTHDEDDLVAVDGLENEVSLTEDGQVLAH